MQYFRPTLRSRYVLNTGPIYIHIDVYERGIKRERVAIREARQNRDFEIVIILPAYRGKVMVVSRRKILLTNTMTSYGSSSQTVLHFSNYSRGAAVKRGVEIVIADYNCKVEGGDWREKEVRKKGRWTPCITECIDTTIERQILSFGKGFEKLMP
uniref:Uncharacterized protein n=1 Tax=Vespula pensylvanica TaxID=30213 RepID=A0A834KTD8_VESPE|nr:hypothetical protein H0235_013531 [Vespula pensylvanica]